MSYKRKCRLRPRKDIANNRFGMLVCKQYQTVNDQKGWICQCDCGNSKWFITNRLTSGNVKSCGCFGKKRCGSDIKTWSGIGEMSGKVVSRIKHMAKVRGLKFLITKEQLWALFLKQDRKCALSGVPLVFASKGTMETEKTASLDRIDSNGDYVIDNIRWVHKDINYMKNDYDNKYFIEMCKKVAEHNK